MKRIRYALEFIVLMFVWFHHWATRGKNHSTFSSIKGESRYWCADCLRWYGRKNDW